MYLDLKIALPTRQDAEAVAASLDPLNIDVTPKGLEVHLRAHGMVPEGLDVDAALATHAWRQPRVLDRQEISG